MQVSIPVVAIALGSCGEPPSGGDDTSAWATDAEATFEDALASLPACEAAEADGRLDLDQGCADGLCTGMDFSDAEDVLGDALGCISLYVDYGPVQTSEVLCLWDTLSATWLDEDRDGDPDRGSGALEVTASLPEWDGTTSDGLGAGASTSCFVDTLGAPAALTLGTAADGSLQPTELHYGGFSALDLYDNDEVLAGGYDLEPDGRIDGVLLLDE
jgi:hypothetical protein